MIGCKQIKPSIALSTSSSVIEALFYQQAMPIFVDTLLPPFVAYDEGALTQCNGSCVTGTFTAHVFIDGVLCFIVTQAANVTPVNLASGETGELGDPSLITCKIISCSTDVTGLFIRCFE